MRTNRLLVAPVALAIVLAGCGSSSGDDAEATTTTKPKATTTSAPATTTTVPDDRFAEDFQSLVADLDAAIDDESHDRDAFAADTDVAGAVGSAADLRDTVFAFDADLRDLEAPDDVASAVNDVLRADGSYIEALDGYAEVTDVDGYNDAYDAEVEARDDWEGQVNDLAEDLDVDGVEPGISGADSGSGDVVEGLDDSGDAPAGDDVTPEGTRVDGGGTIVTTAFSMEVPAGWTGEVVQNTIGLSKGLANGGLFYVADATGDLAVDAATAAEKTGDEVVEDPTDTTVGDRPGIAYFFRTESSSRSVAIYFTDAAETTLFQLTIDTTPEAFADEVGALEAILPSVTFR